MTPQAQKVLRRLKAGRAITPMEALRDFGCFRLSARIYEIRRSGHHVINTWQVAGRKRFARYRLV